MRDKNRIEPFLKEVQEIWEAYPDLRFWQVIEYILSYAPEGQDPFFFEEEKWLKIMANLKKEWEG